MPLLLVSAALADTSCATGWAEAQASVSAAESAWGVDEPAFRSAVASLVKVVPCLVEPLTPSEAAAVHRVYGLAAWLNGDVEAARRAFAAARVADPAWTFPARMAPEGNPVRALYDAATPLPGGDTLPPPKGAHVLLDGANSRTRPLGRPVLLQLVRGEQATTTTWLAAGDPVPAYPRAGEGLRAPLLVGAGVAALGAGALTVVAWRLHDDPPEFESDEDLAGIQAANHGTLIGAAGLGVVALGTGIGAFVVGRW